MLAQTYANIEILLIDDGSSDGSGAIADHFAEKDVRITVFHQPHQGISEARNCGLDVMRGDYVMFVDGDDFVDKAFCKDALALALEHQVDIVSFGFNQLCVQSDKYICKATHAPRLLNKEAAISELIEREDVIYNFVWNKIFKSRLFEGIRFPVARTFEDVAIMHLVFEKSRTGIYVSDRIIYNYRLKRLGSITAGSTSEKSIHDRLTDEFERLEFIKTKYPGLEKKQMKYMLHLCLLGSVYLPDKHDDQKIIRHFLKSNKRECLVVSSGLRTIRLALLFLMPSVFNRINNMLKKQVYNIN